MVGPIANHRDRNCRTNENRANDGCQYHGNNHADTVAMIVFGSGAVCGVLDERLVRIATLIHLNSLPALEHGLLRYSVEGRQRKLGVHVVHGEEGKDSGDGVGVGEDRQVTA